VSSQKQKDAGFLLPNPLTGYALTCVKFYIPNAVEYRAAARGLIMMLGEWHQWEKTYSAGDTRARDVAKIMRDILGDTLTIGVDCEACEGDCNEYAPNAPFIEYAPNDPFLTPDEVPAQYLLPPWYVAPAVNLLGANAGDVVTDIAHSPVGFPVVAGYPRFRVHLDGVGIARLHLVPTITGGYAQVQVDGDILSLVYVDTERDVLAVPPETYNESIYEHEFTTPGAHFIDVSFIPKVNDQLIPPLTFGGGLRKVVLCGFNIMQIVPQWQITESCEFQYSYDGGVTWTTVAGWLEYALDCFQGEPGAPGTPGEPGEPGEPGTPGGEGAGYDWPGGLPDPAAGATTCAVGDAIAKKMLSDFYGWANALYDAFYTRGLSYKETFDEISYGLKISVGAQGATALFNWVGGLIGSTLMAGALGVGGIFTGLVALSDGNAALGWLTIRNDAARYSVENEVACIINDALGGSTAINAAKWASIRSDLGFMTTGGAEFRAAFLDYINTVFPLAAARGAALAYNPNFDCFCDDPGCTGIAPTHPALDLTIASASFPFPGLSDDNDAAGTPLNLYDLSKAAEWHKYAPTNPERTAGNPYRIGGRRDAFLSVACKYMFPDGEQCVNHVRLQFSAMGLPSYEHAFVVGIRSDGRQVLLAQFEVGGLYKAIPGGMDLIGLRYYACQQSTTSGSTTANRDILRIWINSP